MSESEPLDGCSTELPKNPPSPTQEEITAAQSEMMSSAVDDFFRITDSLRTTHPAISAQVNADCKRTFEALRDFVLHNSLGTYSPDNGGTIQTSNPFPPEFSREYRNLRLDMDRASRVRVLIPRSSLISLVSSFDWLIARVLRVALYARPEVLHEKETMTFERLRSFNTIHEARLYVVNRAADGLLRQSRDKQLKWLESKFGIKVRTDKLWARFVEVEQRRHTFVHTDGVVTEDYVRECSAHGAAPSQRLGDLLPIDDEYFEEACECVIEFGLRMAQVARRKLINKDDCADTELTRLTFELIDREYYALAIRILRYAIESPEFDFSSQDQELRNRLNLAQAYKWNGQQAECDTLLRDVDWTATKALFRLAKSCLDANFELALKLVREVGSNCPEATPSAYRDWPLFRELREHAEFPSLFDELFDEPLIKEESIGRES